MADNLHAALMLAPGVLNLADHLDLPGELQDVHLCYCGIFVVVVAVEEGLLDDVVGKEFHWC